MSLAFRASATNHTYQRSLMVFGFTALFLLGCDQAAKVAARHVLVGLNDSIVLIPQVLGLSYVENRGAAFGMLQNQQIIFVAIALLVSAGALYYIIFGHSKSILEVAALACIVSGAIGNLIDRMVFGYVTDFIATLFMRFPVFNIADMAICVGCALFVCSQLIPPRRGNAQDSLHAPSMGEEE